MSLELVLVDKARAHLLLTAPQQSFVLFSFLFCDACSLPGFTEALRRESVPFLFPMFWASPGEVEGTALVF
jgi:hypothetical protein